MKTRIFAALTALFLLAGTTTFAQTTERAKARRERPTSEQMAEWQTKRMAEKLKLDEKQTQALYEYNLQGAKERQKRFEQMGAARQARAEKMKSILTPEQFAQWEQMQQKHHKTMQHGDRKNHEQCTTGQCSCANHQGKTHKECKHGEKGRIEHKHGDGHRHQGVAKQVE